MKVTIVCAGKVKDPAFLSLAGEYAKRIRRYTRLDEVFVRDADSLATFDPGEATMVALEVWGKQLTSQQFAAQLERWGSSGKGEMCFVIGAAEGIPKSLSDRADSYLSLSSMTLPHRLARVVLLEQIYRGLSILRGEPYAREG